MADKDKKDAAQNAVLERIIKDAPTHGSGGHIRDLAEAYAWLAAPRRSSS